ncbi:MAG: hypothetical protein KJN95_05810 [Gammaproteobacteria bacterium]|nr:hypothetical protein [Gammaproteobacteria bacterium]
MSEAAHKADSPEVVVGRLRKKVLGGSGLLLDSLTDAELVAMQALIFKGEAEIVSSACKPFLIAKLETTIIR